jgi:hypothetical protein
MKKAILTGLLIGLVLAMFQFWSQKENQPDADPSSKTPWSVKKDPRNPGRRLPSRLNREIVDQRPPSEKPDWTALNIPLRKHHAIQAFFISPIRDTPELRSMVMQLIEAGYGLEYLPVPLPAR